MAEIELIMPKMGESVAEATITNWLKSEGDSIDAEEAVVEIATDKVDSEIPASESGILKKILFQVDDVVQVGQAIAIIETNASAGSSAPALDSKTEVQSAPTETIAASSQSSTAESQASTDSSGEISKTSASGKFFSPLVRSIAQKEGISMQELESIQGKGKDGRVTKEDLLKHMENRGTSTGTKTEVKTEAAAQASSPSSKAAPKVSLMDNGDEIIQMDRMRKLIADHMVMSKHTSPHVTSFVEADVTNMVMWREKVKAKFQQREGEKLTYTPIVMEAVAKAIKDLPLINISVDGTNIIKKKHINLGMATALPSGNLIVPVIRDADQKNLVGLTKSVNDLANRARTNKLSPDEIQGGTFTVTNVGSFGNIMGTPIINQPQVAILAIGTIKKKPAVIETEQGDTIGIRHMMFLSLSYDHRVVDGSLGGTFVKKVADYLENFDLHREF